MLRKTQAAIRRWTLKLLYPAIEWIGRQHLPYTHRLINGLHYRDLFPRLRPGTVFCTRKRGEMSNLLIPGFYTHVAMYIGDGWVIEAVGRGVVRTDLISFLLSKDYVLAREPLFATTGQMLQAVTWAQRQEGKPYDWQVSPGSKAFYCSELVAMSYWQDRSQPSPFPAKETLGVMVWTPNDVAMADKKWTTIWNSQTSLVTR